LLISHDFWDWLVHGNAIRGPLYPGFLALLDNNLRLARVAQVLIEFATLLIVFRFVRRRWGQVAGLLGAGIWVCYVPLAYYDYSLTVDILYLFFVTWAAVLLFELWNSEVQRPGRAWAAVGVLLGLAELTRPLGAGPFAVAALVVLVVRRGSWSQ